MQGFIHPHTAYSFLMHICTLGICSWVHFVCKYMWMCIHTCRGKRTAMGIIFISPIPFLQDRVSHWPVITKKAKLVDQLGSGILLSLPPQGWDHSHTWLIYAWTLVIKLRSSHKRDECFLMKTILSSLGEGNEVGACFLKGLDFSSFAY